jgi:hypothetical protein
MRKRTLIAIAALTLGVGWATPEAAACCDAQQPACCDPATTDCCTRGDIAAAGVIIPQTIPQIRIPVIDPTFRERRPNRETMTVWFATPVKIGDRILLGRYVIEHDNLRMAQGRPCTHIYAADDLQLPVVAFHCTHLEQAPGVHSTVTLRPLGEPNGMRELVAFQFAGEDGAHGVPGH